MTKILLCHWDIVRFVKETDIVKDDGTFLTLSVTDGKELEFMIFLEKNGSEYEVRVYKGKPSDKYIPYNSDNVKRYEENDEYATFFFEKFDDAIHFVSILGYVHPEYRGRPCRKIGETVKKQTNEKRIEIIDNSNVVQKIINEKHKQLKEVQEECRHEILVDLFNYTNYYDTNFTKKCLFCGKMFSKDTECKYTIKLLSLSTTLPFSTDEEYLLVQEIFKKIAKTNSQMSIKDVYEKVLELFCKKDKDFYVLQDKVFKERH